MKAVALAVAAVAVTGCLALSGCGSKAEAAECGKQNSNQDPVEIKVYNDNGPKVKDAECVVLPGSRIDWVNDDGNDVQFKLKFKTANPGGQGQPLKVKSQKHDGKFKVKITAEQLAPGEKERRFEYDIVADGTPLDPAIIIRAQ